MSKFEKASRMKLRFDSDKGVIDVEDLWTLSLTKLNKMAVALNKELKASSEENYLEETSAEDTVTRLRFDIVIHILETKKEEAKARKEASHKKEEKERLLDILSRKEHEADEALSPEELRKRIEELG